MSILYSAFNSGMDLLMFCPIMKRERTSGNSATRTDIEASANVMYHGSPVDACRPTIPSWMAVTMENLRLRGVWVHGGVTNRLEAFRKDEDSICSV